MWKRPLFGRRAGPLALIAPDYGFAKGKEAIPQWMQDGARNSASQDYYAY